MRQRRFLVGLDGITRVADFGVAKFERRSGASTTDGHLKGKLAYMAPEYLEGKTIDRRLDVFAMGVVLWEALCGRRLFRSENEPDTMRRVLDQPAPPVSEEVPSLGTALDAVVATALAKAPEQRFDNVRAMALALETSGRAAGLVAGRREVADLVTASAGAEFEERRARIRTHLAHEPSVGSAVVASIDVPPIPSTIDEAPPPIAAAPLLPMSTLRSADTAPGTGPNTAAVPVMSAAPPLTRTEAAPSDTIQTSTLPLPGAPRPGAPPDAIAQDTRWAQRTPTGAAAPVARDVAVDAGPPEVPMTSFGWVGRGAIAAIAVVGVTLAWMEHGDAKRDDAAPLHGDAPAASGSGSAPSVPAALASAAAPATSAIPAMPPSAGAAQVPKPPKLRDARHVAPKAGVDDPPPNPYAD